MSLNLLILAKNKKLYSHRRLVEAAEQRGHTIRVISPLACYMNISSEKPVIHYRGNEIIENIDAIIPRIGASVTFYGTAIVRQFEMRRVYALNSSIAISRSRDKLRSLQLLSRKGIPMPTTGFASSVLDTENLINMFEGERLIIKLLEGTQGKGIVLAETKAVAKSVIEAFKQVDANFLVQEYIEEAGGADIRCLVLGDKVIAAIKRTAKDGEFRSNLHQGGSAEVVKLTKEERSIAIQATKAMRLGFAGVDIIRSKRGPLVLEVNSSPGIEGVEKTTHINVAEQIIMHIEKAVCNHRPEKDIDA